MVNLANQTFITYVIFTTVTTTTTTTTTYSYSSNYYYIVFTRYTIISIYRFGIAAIIYTICTTV